MKYHANEMALRVLTKRIAGTYANADEFMARIEDMFVASNGRPVNIIISKIPVARRLRIYTPESETDVDRIATLGECQNLVTMLRFGSNCFRCREEDGALSGEHLLKVNLPVVVLS